MSESQIPLWLAVVGYVVIAYLVLSPYDKGE